MLLPLAAAAGGLGWPTLALVLAGLEAPHLEAPLRARLEPFRASTAKEKAISMMLYAVSIFPLQECCLPILHARADSMKLCTAVVV